MKRRRHVRRRDVPVDAVTWLYERRNRLMPGVQGHVAAEPDRDLGVSRGLGGPGGEVAAVVVRGFLAGGLVGVGAVDEAQLAGLAGGERLSGGDCLECAGASDEAEKALGAAHTGGRPRFTWGSPRW